MCPINNFTESLKFSENCTGGSGPDEGTFVSVVEGDVAVDIADEFAHVAE